MWYFSDSFVLLDSPDATNLTMDSGHGQYTQGHLASANDKAVVDLLDGAQAMHAGELVMPAALKRLLPAV